MTHIRICVRHRYGDPVFEMVLSMSQMMCTGWIATTQRTLLKVALQNVATRERILAEMALIWSLPSMSQQMSLQMFKVQICLDAMGTLEFVIRIFGRYRWSFPLSGWRTARMSW